MQVQLFVSKLWETGHRSSVVAWQNWVSQTNQILQICIYGENAIVFNQEIRIDKVNQNFSFCRKRTRDYPWRHPSARKRPCAPLLGFQVVSKQHWETHQVELACLASEERLPWWEHSCLAQRSSPGSIHCWHPLRKEQEPMHRPASYLPPWRQKRSEWIKWRCSMRKRWVRLSRQGDRRSDANLAQNRIKHYVISLSEIV